MFIVIMILIGYIIYMIGFIKSYRDPSNNTSPFLYLTILLVCIAIGLVINLIVIERVNYETALINTLNVLSFEKHTGSRGTFLFGIGSIKEEIRYHITAEKDGQIIIYSLEPEEVQIYKAKDNQSKLEIYAVNCNNPILQKLFILPVRTKYKLFLQEEFLQK